MSIIMKVSYMMSNNARQVECGLVHHQPVKVSIALYFIIARHMEYGLVHLQPVKVSIALYFIWSSCIIGNCHVMLDSWQLVTYRTNSRYSHSDMLIRNAYKILNTKMKL